MGQSGARMDFFIRVRTLTTVAAVLGVWLIATIGAGLVCLERRTEIGGVEDEGITKRLWVAQLGVAVTIALLSLGLMVAIPQPLLEEDGDIVCDALKVLVALCLCGLEPAGDVAAHKGHRDGIC